MQEQVKKSTDDSPLDNLKKIKRKTAQSETFVCGTRTIAEFKGNMVYVHATLQWGSVLPCKTIPVPLQDHANQSSEDLALVHKDLYFIIVSLIPLTRIEFQYYISDCYKYVFELFAINNKKLKFQSRGISFCGWTTLSERNPASIMNQIRSFLKFHTSFFINLFMAVRKTSCNLPSWLIWN